MALRPENSRQDDHRPETHIKSRRVEPVTQPAIADYAVIGDCRSAALVSHHASIDWLCLPRFDSPPVFAALLDPTHGGCFSIRPAAPARTARQYVNDTNVLETTFTTATGVLRVTDLLPVDDEASKAKELWPDHELLRRIECLKGEVGIQTLFEPRFDYGRVAPRIDRREAGVCYCEHGARALALSTDMSLAVDRGQTRLLGNERLSAGSKRYLSLTYAHGMPTVLAPLGPEADRRIERSVAWWHQWMSSFRYLAPGRVWRPAVRTNDSLHHCGTVRGVRTASRRTVSRTCQPMMHSRC